MESQEHLGEWMREVLMGVCQTSLLAFPIWKFFLKRKLSMLTRRRPSKQTPHQAHTTHIVYTMMLPLVSSLIVLFALCHGKYILNPNVGYIDPEMGAKLASAQSRPIQVDIDDGWHVFFFSDTTHDGFPEFSVCNESRAVLEIVDLLCPGDSFDVLAENGTVLIGQTSTVPLPDPDDECPVDTYTTEPSAAMASPVFSKGAFVLASGIRTITIRPRVSPFGSGMGFLRLVSLPD